MTLTSKPIIVFFSICTFLLGTFTTSAKGNPVADSLFAIGQYKLASLEFEREYFMSNSKTEKNEALVKKTECYKLEGDFKAAFETIDRIALFGLSDSIRFVILYQKALCAYLSERLMLAQSYILQLQSNYKYYNKPEFIKVNILQTLIYNEQRNWKAASSNLYAMRDSIKQIVEFDLVLSNYSRKNIPHMKNESVQFWISFLPGAGIAYAGKPLEGLFNFTINAAALAFGAHQVYYKYYLTGYFGGTFLLQKFYLGGRKRGEFLLEKRNYLVSNKFNNKVKFELINLSNEIKKGK